MRFPEQMWFSEAGKMCNSWMELEWVQTGMDHQTLITEWSKLRSIILKKPDMVSTNWCTPGILVFVIVCPRFSGNSKLETKTLPELSSVDCIRDMSQHFQFTSYHNRGTNSIKYSSQQKKLLDQTKHKVSLAIYKPLWHTYAYATHCLTSVRVPSVCSLQITESVKNSLCSLSWSP